MWAGGIIKKKKKKPAGMIDERVVKIHKKHSKKKTRIHG